MLHLQRTVELLEGVIADRVLQESALYNHRALSLEAGAGWLLTLLTTSYSDPPKTSEVLASLHRLRGLCDFEPFERFAPQFDEAIAEASQSVLLGKNSD